MQLNRSIAIIIVTVIMAGTLGGCTQKAQNQESFIINQSISLAAESRSNISEYITIFIQYDEYVLCTCSYILPGRPAEKLLSSYDSLLTDILAITLINDYSYTLSSSRLDELTNG